MMQIQQIMMAVVLFVFRNTDTFVLARFLFVLQLAGMEPKPTMRLVMTEAMTTLDAQQDVEDQQQATYALTHIRIQLYVLLLVETDRTIIPSVLLTQNNVMTVIFLHQMDAARHVKLKLVGFAAGFHLYAAFVPIMSLREQKYAMTGQMMGLGAGLDAQVLL